MTDAINWYRGDGAATLSTAYYAETNLRNAVNMAIHLQRPLLVKGPPGCGKTRLAASVAEELRLPLYSWYVKSTSKARDGLYVVDVVRRLADVQLDPGKARRVTPYIRFGPLGEALRSEHRSVVLIDEIDKADIDFPNDLLHELEDRGFEIDEIDDEELTVEERSAGFSKYYRQRSAPIVIVTSNDEKQLPDAFLRRCIFCWVDFPGPAQLARIVRSNIDIDSLDSGLVQRCIAAVVTIRKMRGLRKAPATSELIDWVRILQAWGVDLGELDRAPTISALPFWRILFKHESDLQRILRQGDEEGAG